MRLAHDVIRVLPRVGAIGAARARDEAGDVVSWRQGQLCIQPSVARLAIVSEAAEVLQAIDGLRWPTGHGQRRKLKFEKLDAMLRQHRTGAAQNAKVEALRVHLPSRA